VAGLTKDGVTEGVTSVGKAAPTRAALAALAGTVLVVLMIDLATKQLALTNLSDGSRTRLLGGALWFDLTRNSGAAFSIGSGFTWVFPLVAIVVVGAIGYLARHLRSTPWALSLGLILGGALGNLIDRLFRAPGPLQGHVVDFISVFGPAGERFPIFNAADSSLFCGVALAIYLEFTGRRRDGTRLIEGSESDPAAAGPRAGVRDSHRDEA
jgi:signal peptidase II